MTQDSFFGFNLSYTFFALNDRNSIDLFNNNNLLHEMEQYMSV